MPIMERVRFSISGIMGFIAIAAVGLVGLREGTEVWASLTFALTAIALLMAVPSLIYSQGAERAGWVGFTLFGWVYLVFMFSPWSYQSPGIPSFPTNWLLTTVHERIHAKPQYIPNPNYPGAQSIPGMSIPQFEMPQILKPGTTYWMGNELNYRQVGHCLLALAFGALGTLWFRIVYAFHARRRPAAGRPPAEPS
jgi:hypothetical protein